MNPMQPILDELTKASSNANYSGINLGTAQGMLEEAANQMPEPQATLIRKYSKSLGALAAIQGLMKDLADSSREFMQLQGQSNPPPE